MKRCVALFSLCAALALPVSGQTTRRSYLRDERPQEPCTVKIADLPPLRGLTLGMARADIQRKYPVAFTDLGDGDSQLGTVRHDDAVAELEGVESIHLTLFDGKLVSMAINYELKTVWGIDEFIEKIAPALRLPTVWARERYMADGAKIKCDGFSASASAKYQGASLTLAEDGLLEKRLQRARERREKEKESFKP